MLRLEPDEATPRRSGQGVEGAHSRKDAVQGRVYRDAVCLSASAPMDRVRAEAEALVAGHCRIAAAARIVAEEVRA